MRADLDRLGLDVHHFRDDREQPPQIGQGLDRHPRLRLDLHLPALRIEHPGRNQCVLPGNLVGERTNGSSETLADSDHDGVPTKRVPAVADD